MSSLRFAPIAALLLGIGLNPGPAAAADPAAAPPRSASVTGASTLSGKLELSFADAIAMAVQNNLDVELRRIDPLVAREVLGVTLGAFDPEFFARGGLSDSEIPIASALQVNSSLDERIHEAETGLNGLIPLIGGSYGITFAGQDVETNSSIASLSPELRSSLSAALQVPLLRGLLWGEPWTAVRVSRVGVNVADEDFRTALMDTVRRTEDAYWGLVAAQQATRVAQKSLETAQALLEQTEAQFEVGVVSRVEVVEAEAGVANREFSLIRDDATERNQADLLIDIVLGPYLAPLSAVEIVLTDSPDVLTVTDVDVESAAEKAFSQRPELAAARRVIEQRALEQKFASLQRLPQLDVVGSYGYQGLAGRDNPNRFNFANPGAPPPPIVGIDREFGDSLDDYFDAGGSKQWSLGGRFSIPLGNVRARHEHTLAELELRRARTQLRRLEQNVITEIRIAARTLRSAIQGIDAAERGRVAAAEQLRAERVRLEYGESTPFDVLQREEDLVLAETQKISAQQIYRASITELERAQGTILERHGILVEEAAVLR